MEGETVVSKRLKGLMAENDITLIDLSEGLNISAGELSMKINDGDNWLYKEMAFITNLFGYKEIQSVFPELYNSVLTAKLTAKLTFKYKMLTNINKKINTVLMVLALAPDFTGLL